MWLIEQSQKHFWYKEYDTYGRKIMDDLDKRITHLILFYVLLIYATSFVYMLYGITESVGKAGEDRIHPIRFRLLKNPTTTPYYEVVFVLETVSTTHMGICFCSFDNFLYVLSMNIGGQFKILRNKMETIFIRDDSKGKSIQTYHEFKKCIAHHHLLISFVNKLECVFCFPLICQLLISSIVLCVAGFQLSTHNEVLMKKVLFLAYIFGGFIQIFLITMNCNNIMDESGAIGNAIYNSNWAETSYDEFNQFRKDMVTVMLRSKCPCKVTAAKFFPISLQSFTNVLSTTASYLTLLRTMANEEQ
ncbi:PREDICTED: odorant receptor 13a-like [Eufriesea mexicana]|uniref:odorant receptor 13a-like n=1 Tax=Eufriesea mexicana TaxID=516756 RepID=UPI00083C4CEC|nr:PREDICTED: odorant receptor 13a-like [Eufriesea mexicana]